MPLTTAKDAEGYPYVIDLGGDRRLVLRCVSHKLGPAITAVIQIAQDLGNWVDAVLYRAEANWSLPDTPMTLLAWFKDEQAIQRSRTDEIDDWTEDEGFITWRRIYPELPAIEWFAHDLTAAIDALLRLGVPDTKLAFHTYDADGKRTYLPANVEEKVSETFVRPAEPRKERMEFAGMELLVVVLDNLLHTDPVYINHTPLLYATGAYLMELSHMMSRHDDPTFSQAWEDFRYACHAEGWWDKPEYEERILRILREAFLLFAENLQPEKRPARQQREQVMEFFQSAFQDAEIWEEDDESEED